MMLHKETRTTETDILSLQGIPILLKIFLTTDGSLTRLLCLTMGAPVVASILSGEKGERRVFLGTSHYPKLILASSCLTDGGDYQKTWEILKDPRPIGTVFAERGEFMIREDLSISKRDGTPLIPDPWQGHSLWMRSSILSNMDGVRISIQEIFLPQLIDFIS
jgi:chorismate-pyruvate lyase